MSTDAPKWVWIAYYAISAFFLLSGIVGFLFGFGVLGKGIDAISLVSGFVDLLLGVGLLFRVELIRGIINVLCFVRMVGAAWGAFQGFFLSPLLGPFAALMLIMQVIQFCTAGFMIFLIGETDKKAPNL